MKISTQHYACLDVPKMVKKCFSLVWLPTVGVLNLEKSKCPPFWIWHIICSHALFDVKVVKNWSHAVVFFMQIWKVFGTLKQHSVSSIQNIAVLRLVRVNSMVIDVITVSSWKVLTAWFNFRHSNASHCQFTKSISVLYSISNCHFLKHFRPSPEWISLISEW